MCLVTNLPRYRCDHCIAKDPSARAQVGRTITTTTTTARYKGQCNYCRDPIEIGDRIRRDLDGVSWVHADHDLNARRLLRAAHGSRPLSTARSSTFRPSDATGPACSVTYRYKTRSQMTLSIPWVIIVEIVSHD